ncbi:MAG TPA: BTAD domain-containing putative transcriptional regulator, partial [Acidimicrobiia bacterium]
GRPFEDAFPTPELEHDAARLEELHLTALEAWGEAQLAVGRHLELIPELRRLTVEPPLHEGVLALLMLGLYRSGRQSEAAPRWASTGVHCVHMPR